MCMDEALRENVPEMFNDSLVFGRSHLEKCWTEKDGNQGLILVYKPDEKDPYAGSKINNPYVMKEVFVFCLLALEHTHEKWAAEWFDRAFSYSYETPLEFPYRDTLHQPRGVMFCLEILNRMIERNGVVSEFLS